jgi:nicotinamidase-related amidase
MEMKFMKDPTAPEVKPIIPHSVTLNPSKTALLILELSDYCNDPDYMSAPLVPGINKLLKKGRSAGIPIAFTIPLPWKGQPHGKVYSGFNKRFSEPVFFLGGFDKFNNGQIKSLLDLYDIDTLIIAGGKANMAVLYTATTAAVEYNYNVIIPIDGIISTTDYEKEYTLYQFRVYPDGSYNRFKFTKLDMIDFNSGKLS